MTAYLLAIDQGTTNSRVIIFDGQMSVVSHHELPLQQTFPRNGWVEQDPQELLTNTLQCIESALKKANLTAAMITACGIANQRETTLVWNKHTGVPIYPAIVWQDRRTSDYCEQKAQSALGTYVREKTGLMIDPYFSASKIRWLLEHCKGARIAADRGELLFGTVDTYLLWHFTHGKRHATDVTNAARTLLFNIQAQKWDNYLLQQFEIPESLLPEVLDSAAHYGEIDASYFGHAIPITAMIGDQQSACIGQAVLTPGTIKGTYGTGCFVLLNTGEHLIQSRNQLLTTVAYRIKGELTYCLEGSIFSAGSTIKWLRDQLHFIGTSADSEKLARSVTNTNQVYLVPAFTGLSAPYWDSRARGAIVGLTFNAGIAEIVRAGLESVAYQTRDLLEAMNNDTQKPLTTLRVDGGMVMNDWLLQFIADLLNVPVERPQCTETTALGAAMLAGLQIGLYQTLEELASLWRLEKRFEPQMPAFESENLYAGWKQAVKRVLE
ncbi:MAG: glycerol kinase GlpK [Gammaproteobacteria bacterium]|nr:glycerol kinase GlpK [Gammaproteobacteria bacterium]